MLTMVGTKIAVEPLDEPDQIGSIYVPDSAKTRINQGIVKYIGPDVTSIEVGSHVLFSGYTGTVITLEGEGRLIVLEEQFVQCLVYDDSLEIPGLYHLERDGKPFPATYESIITLIRHAYSESHAFKRQREFRLKRGVDGEREFKNA